MKSFFKAKVKVAWLVGLFLGISGEYVIAQNLYQIYDQLYLASGFSELQKPKLIIVNSSTKAAAYSSLTHIISVEEKVLRICRSLGRDSSSAMAYLLAHELSHAFEEIKGNENSNFIADQQINKSMAEEEMYADIKGAFLCALSGFNVERIIPPLIEKIYKQYRFSELKNSGYPTKANRLNSYSQMLAKLNQLIILYETANFLNIEEEHELARDCYQLILNSYRGPEIYNNIGLAELMESMNWYHNKWDRFVYPLAMDINSALYKASKSRGELSAENELLRNNKLKKAYAKFQLAHQLNPSYQPAWINIISCLNMMGRPEAAARFIDSLAISDILKLSKNEESQKLKLAMGITYSLLGRNDSKDYFDQCLNSNSIQINYMAQINLSYVNQDPLADKRSICSIVFSDTNLSNPDLKKDKIKKHWVLSSADKRINFSYHRQGEISGMFISGQLGPVINLYRSKNIQKNEIVPDRSHFSLADPGVIYMSNNQSEYMKCRSDKTLYRFDKKGKMIEKIWIKKY